MRKRKNKKVAFGIIGILFVAVLGCFILVCPFSDSSSDVDLVKLAFSEKYSKDVDEITLNIAYQALEHMRGMVSLGNTPADSGIFLATKIDGSWEIVFDGNGSIPCEIAAEYGFPISFVDDCKPQGLSRN
jgi:hypothetical protein